MRQEKKAFAALREEIGTSPASILAASFEQLARVVKPAAMTTKLVARLREIALIALQEYGGDLQDVISRPPAQAKKALMKFPSIGEPGAEKILLFANAYPVLALDSNGLRVLIRLGFGEERKSYVATYRSAQQAAEVELKDDCTSKKRAYSFAIAWKEHMQAHTAKVRKLPANKSMRVLCKSCLMALKEGLSHRFSI